MAGPLPRTSETFQLLSDTVPQVPGSTCQEGMWYPPPFVDIFSHISDVTAVVEHGFPHCLLSWERIELFREWWATTPAR